MTRFSLNCWEFMGCGREPGGAEAVRLGPCPAASDTSYDALNAGHNGGRICWAVAGTCCGGKVQGTFAEKRSSCVDCELFQKVHQEQREAHPSTQFLKILCDEGHSALLKRLSYRRIRQEERFISQGEISDRAYIIETGSCLLVVEKHGVLHPVDHRGQSDIVGELSIITGEPQNAHVEAQTDMGVWVLDQSQFQDLSGNQPELLDLLTELVADRFDSRRPMADRRIVKYIATEIIGRGGYSIVYKGRHSHLDMDVAIKMLKLDMALRKDFLAGFWNEARTIARLNHENIFRVFDMEERYRTLFIIMEYLKGESLAHLLERSERLDPPLAVGFLRQLCDGLEYAHGHGLIHGDINPSNVTICDGRRLKILDFGLSCPADRSICDMAGGTPELEGMGATLTGVVVPRPHGQLGSGGRQPPLSCVQRHRAADHQGPDDALIPAGRRGNHRRAGSHAPLETSAGSVRGPGKLHSRNGAF
jgi:eukaryotic-like serine/threonine-protein kinase